MLSFCETNILRFSFKNIRRIDRILDEKKGNLFPVLWFTLPSLSSAKDLTNCKILLEKSYRDNIPRLNEEPMLRIMKEN